MWFIKLQRAPFPRLLGKATQDPQEACGYAAESKLKHRSWLQAADATTSDSPLTETQNSSLKLTELVPTPVS